MSLITQWDVCVSLITHWDVRDYTGMCVCDCSRIGMCVIALECV